ncbi:hypothetical protein [Kribbella sp. CA-293567]|uniref:hypothetical protein n=1 Tax=Kribbella sp. CA-293567 TaxID=3002436 RepID=UPI0022DDC59B|nr:hypothetical protein [Kribbella sp. CA-293567]WBQ03981.1 hypothetical protein OX958_28940 [Kribbella sp. CA-293567]
MVTDATKKLREPVAYLLLAFTGLVALAFLFRLFVGSAGFTNAAGLVQSRITPPEIQALVLLIALVAAVWLVNDAGERTPNARLVTIGALSITGLLALLSLIGAFAGFNETSTAGVKIVAFIFSLGGLALYAAAGLYIFKTFQALPAPVRAPKAGPQGQFAGQQGQYGAPAQYGQQGGQYGQPGAQQGQQYGQYGAQQGQYGQNDQAGQYGAYGAGAAGAAAGAAGGYAAAQGGEQQWPQEQSWNQGGEQQAAWTGSDAEAQPQADSAAAQPAEQAWSAEGQTAEPTQQWSPEGQQWPAQEQGQQWPQEQQQWGGADSGQQWGQEQYGQPAQQEWPAQEAAQPEQQSWPQEGQAWQGEQAAPATDQPAEAAPEGVDETRVEPPVSDAPKGEEAPQQGQPGQQGWWSQPS